MEEEAMGMRTKNNWRKTILEPDNESGLKRTLPRALKGEDKQALWSVCTGQIKVPYPYLDQMLEQEQEVILTTKNAILDGCSTVVL